MRRRDFLGMSAGTALLPLADSAWAATGAVGFKRFVVVLLRSIWMFTKFDTPWLIIQGGGAEPYIRTLPIYTYQRTFAYYEAGRGSAMAVLMFLMLVAAAALYFHLWRREEQL